MKKRKGNSLRGTAYRLLAVRDRSYQELREALLKRGFEEIEVDDIMDELQDIGYVDDERLARQTAERCLEDGKTGPLRLRHELLKRGVSSNTVERIVEETFRDVEVQNIALHLAVKKLNTRRGTRTQQMGRLGRFLLRRGFTRTTVNWVIDQLFDSSL